MTRFSALILAATASVALLAAPVMAQTASPGDNAAAPPSSTMPAPPPAAPMAAPPASGTMAAPPSSGAMAPQGSMSQGSMSGMAMPKKGAAKKPMKTASAKSTKLTCMDYAWQSQAEKDCEAGTTKPPNWR